MNEEKRDGHTSLDADPLALRAESPSHNGPSMNEHDGIRKDLSEFERASADIQRKNLAATRVIALVTALYMGFAALQWWTMRNQLAEIKSSSADTHNLAAATASYAADMKRLAEQTTSQATQTKSLAESGKTSADAVKISANNSDRIARGSEAAVKTAQASMRLDQRAWIGIREFSEFHYVADGPPTVNIVVVNTGKSPARNVRLHSEFQFVPTGLAAPPADMSTLPGYSSTTTLKTVTVLHAGQSTVIAFKPGVYNTAAYHPEIYAAVKDGRQVLYLRVLITYDDVFAPEHTGVGLHRTEVCEKYIPTLEGLFGCDFGNYAN